MSRSHAKHLHPKKYAERAQRLKRVAKTHKQKRTNARTKLRKEFL